MKRYYQIKGYSIESKELKELIKLKINTQDKDLKERLNGIYKQTICRIRKDLGIRNVIGLYILKEYNNKVYVLVYDYLLPTADWNCWCIQNYDEEKELWYIEIEDEVN